MFTTSKNNIILDSLLINTLYSSFKMSTSSQLSNLKQNRKKYIYNHVHSKKYKTSNIILMHLEYFTVDQS